MLKPISFLPVYQERVWGGRALADSFGRILPGTGPIGESWELVDRPEAQSVVGPGTPGLAGLTLRELIRGHAKAILGPQWDHDRPFPILVKWLDCRERLSLQVHPPKPVAARLGGQSKTENWFIAACEPGASIIVGLAPGVTPEQFRAAIDGGDLESCVRHVEVHAGDSVLVESGTVHAIDAGNLILEVQENSDTTYRVYDWGRVGLDGKPRTLHVGESMQSIDFDAPLPAIVRAADNPATLARSREFILRRVPVAAGGEIAFRAGEQCRIFHVIRGVFEFAESGLVARRGDNLLIPFETGGAFRATEDSLALITEDFSD
ncbi:MAG TPA: type I phosphomannose isomerase catalytic subunit [Opitutaceae bacterium]|nr:type I phosphomannose isomerase catalytic subunit [Opitutaceae bacterium]